MSETLEKPEEENKNTTLSLNDLASIRNIVNVASRRGAFEAGEFEDVGKVYNKLDTFLKEQGKLLEEHMAKEEAAKEGVGTETESVEVN